MTKLWFWLDIRCGVEGRTTTEIQARCRPVNRLNRNAADYQSDSVPAPSGAPKAGPWDGADHGVTPRLNIYPRASRTTSMPGGTLEALAKPDETGPVVIVVTVDGIRGRNFRGEPTWDNQLTEDSTSASRSSG